MTFRKPTLTEIICVLAGIAAGMVITFAGRRAAPADLDLLPERILETFALRPDELPDDFFEVQDEQILSQAGLKRNPSFITRNADRKLQVQMKAFGGILGLYGTDEEVLLLLKGYFFPDEEDARTYLEIQEGLRRKINAYEVATPGGSWFLFLATDPEREYTSEEIRSIKRGLEAYQNRLNAVAHFQQIRVEDR
jgi:hypothetical protein